MKEDKIGKLPKLNDQRPATAVTGPTHGAVDAAEGSTPDGRTLPAVPRRPLFKHPDFHPRPLTKDERRRHTFREQPPVHPSIVRLEAAVRTLRLQLVTMDPDKQQTFQGLLRMLPRDFAEVSSEPLRHANRCPVSGEARPRHYRMGRTAAGSDGSADERLKPTGLDLGEFSNDAAAMAIITAFVEAAPHLRTVALPPLDDSTHGDQGQKERFLAAIYAAISRNAAITTVLNAPAGTAEAFADLMTRNSTLREAGRERTRGRQREQLIHRREEEILAEKRTERTHLYNILRIGISVGDEQEKAFKSLRREESGAWGRLLAHCRASAQASEAARAQRELTLHDEQLSVVAEAAAEMALTHQQEVEEMAHILSAEQAARLTMQFRLRRIEKARVAERDGLLTGQYERRKVLVREEADGRRGIIEAMLPAVVAWQQRRKEMEIAKREEEKRKAERREAEQLRRAQAERERVLMCAEESEKRSIYESEARRSLDYIQRTMAEEGRLCMMAQRSREGAERRIEEFFVADKKPPRVFVRLDAPLVQRYVANSLADLHMIAPNANVVLRLENAKAMEDVHKRRKLEIRSGSISVEVASAIFGGEDCSHACEGVMLYVPSRPKKDQPKDTLQDYSSSDVTSMSQLQPQRTRHVLPALKDVKDPHPPPTPPSLRSPSDSMRSRGTFQRPSSGSFKAPRPSKVKAEVAIPVFQALPPEVAALPEPAPTIPSELLEDDNVCVRHYAARTPGMLLSGGSSTPSQSPASTTRSQSRHGNANAPDYDDTLSEDRIFGVLDLRISRHDPNKRIVTWNGVEIGVVVRGWAGPRTRAATLQSNMARQSLLRGLDQGEGPATAKGSGLEGMLAHRREVLRIDLFAGVPRSAISDILGHLAYFNASGTSATDAGNLPSAISIHVNLQFRSSSYLAHGIDPTTVTRRDHASGSSAVSSRYVFSRKSEEEVQKEAAATAAAAAAAQHELLMHPLVPADEETTVASGRFAVCCVGSEAPSFALPREESKLYAVPATTENWGMPTSRNGLGLPLPSDRFLEDSALMTVLPHIVLDCNALVAHSGAGGGTLQGSDDEGELDSHSASQTFMTTVSDIAESGRVLARRQSARVVGALSSSVASPYSRLPASLLTDADTYASKIGTKRTAEQLTRTLLQELAGPWASNAAALMASGAAAFASASELRAGAGAAGRGTVTWSSTASIAAASSRLPPATAPSRTDELSDDHSEMHSDDQDDSMGPLTMSATAPILTATAAPKGALLEAAPFVPDSLNPLVNFLQIHVSVQNSDTYDVFVISKREVVAGGSSDAARILAESKKIVTLGPQKNIQVRVTGTAPKDPHAACGRRACLEAVEAPQKDIGKCVVKSVREVLFKGMVVAHVEGRVFTEEEFDATRRLIAAAPVDYSQRDSRGRCISRAVSAYVRPYEPLVITPTEQCTLTAFLTLLNSIGYASMTKDPDQGERVIDVSVIQGPMTACVLRRTLCVEPVDDPTIVALQPYGGGGASRGPMKALPASQSDTILADFAKPSCVYRVLPECKQELSRFVPNEPVFFVCPEAVVTDPDTVEFCGGYLEIEITEGLQDGDCLFLALPPMIGPPCRSTEGQHDTCRGMPGLLQPSSYSRNETGAMITELRTQLIAAARRSSASRRQSGGTGSMLSPGSPAGGHRVPSSAHLTSDAFLETPRASAVSLLESSLSQASAVASESLEDMPDVQRHVTLPDAPPERESVIHIRRCSINTTINADSAQYAKGAATDTNNTMLVSTVRVVEGTVLERPPPLFNRRELSRARQLVVRAGTSGSGPSLKLLTRSKIQLEFGRCTIETVQQILRSLAFKPCGTLPGSLATDRSQLGLRIIEVRAALGNALEPKFRKFDPEVPVRAHTVVHVCAPLISIAPSQTVTYKEGSGPQVLPGLALIDDQEGDSNFSAMSPLLSLGASSAPPRVASSLLASYLAMATTTATTQPPPVERAYMGTTSAAVASVVAASTIAGCHAVGAANTDTRPFNRGFLHASIIKGATDDDRLFLRISDPITTEHGMYCNDIDPASSVVDAAVADESFGASSLRSPAKGAHSLHEPDARCTKPPPDLLAKVRRVVNKSGEGDAKPPPPHNVPFFRCQELYTAKKVVVGVATSTPTELFVGFRDCDKRRRVAKGMAEREVHREKRAQDKKGRQDEDEPSALAPHGNHMLIMHQQGPAGAAAAILAANSSNSDAVRAPMHCPLGDDASPLLRSEVQCVIRSLVYENRSANPIELRKLIRIVLCDEVSRTELLIELIVQPVDDVTEIHRPVGWGSSAGPPVPFRNGFLGSAFPFLEGCYLVDPDTEYFNAGYLMVQLSAGACEGDQLRLMSLEEQREANARVVERLEAQRRADAAEAEEGGSRSRSASKGPRPSPKATGGARPPLPPKSQSPRPQSSPGEASLPLDVPLVLPPHYEPFEFVLIPETREVMLLIPHDRTSPLPPELEGDHADGDSSAADDDDFQQMYATSSFADLQAMSRADFDAMDDVDEEDEESATPVGALLATPQYQRRRSTAVRRGCYTHPEGRLRKVGVLVPNVAKPTGPQSMPAVPRGSSEFFGGGDGSGLFLAVPDTVQTRKRSFSQNTAASASSNPSPPPTTVSLLVKLSPWLRMEDREIDDDPARCPHACAVSIHLLSALMRAVVYTSSDPPHRTKAGPRTFTVRVSPGGNAEEGKIKIATNVQPSLFAVTEKSAGIGKRELMFLASSNAVTTTIEIPYDPSGGALAIPQPLLSSSPPGTPGLGSSPQITSLPAFEGARLAKLADVPRDAITPLKTLVPIGDVMVRRGFARVEISLETFNPHTDEVKMLEIGKTFTVRPPHKLYSSSGVYCGVIHPITVPLPPNTDFGASISSSVHSHSAVHPPKPALPPPAATATRGYLLTFDNNSRATTHVLQQLFRSFQLCVTPDACRGASPFDTDLRQGIRQVQYAVCDGSAVTEVTRIDVAVHMPASPRFMEVVQQAAALNAPTSRSVSSAHMLLGAASSAVAATRRFTTVRISRSNSRGEDGAEAASSPPALPAPVVIQEKAFVSATPRPPLPTKKKSVPFCVRARGTQGREPAPAQPPPPHDRSDISHSTSTIAESDTPSQKSTPKRPLSGSERVSSRISNVDERNEAIKGILLSGGRDARSVSQSTRSSLSTSHRSESSVAPSDSYSESFVSSAPSASAREETSLRSEREKDSGESSGRAPAGGSSPPPAEAPLTAGSTSPSASVTESTMTFDTHQSRSILSAASEVLPAPATAAATSAVPLPAAVPRMVPPSESTSSQASITSSEAQPTATDNTDTTTESSLSMEDEL